MSVNVYARITKLTDVCGRMDYISNPERQENLLAFVDTTADDPAYWKTLAMESQEAWRSSGASSRTHQEVVNDPETGKAKKVEVQNKCCEAREIQGDLPNDIAAVKDLGEVAWKLATDFRNQFGSDCALAIHMNKSMTNLHYHLIHSERTLLDEPVIKTADRAVFLDENGVRKRTKKEILDDDGKLCSGCKIIKKGETLSVRRFGEKEDLFSKNSWNQEIKHWMANWINENLQPDQERTVFDPAGPYLAQVHVGKGCPKEKKEEILKYNQAVRNYNEMVNDGTIDRDEAKATKGYIMMSPNRTLALKELYNIEPEKKVKRVERTKDNPTVATLKRELREQYRLAAKARIKASETKNEIDKRLLLQEARKHSQEIDRLKVRLGLAQAEDEEDRRYWEAQKRLQTHKEYWSRKKNLTFIGNDIRSLERERSYLMMKYLNTGLFDEENDRIRAELAAIEDQLAEEYKKKRQAKADLRELKYTMREEKRKARKTASPKAQDRTNQKEVGYSDVRSKSGRQGPSGR